MFKEFFAGNILVDMRDNKSGLHKVEIGTSPQTKCVKIFSSDMSHSYWVYSGYYRIAEKEEIAAGHRIDKTPLMQHLDKCEEVVKTWPKWKLQSIRDAFGIPVLDNDMGDDSHIENHISKNCKVIDIEELTK